MSSILHKYIDHIFYINLNSRDDRRKEIETELKGMNLSFERFDAIRHARIGLVGCSKSHQGVYKLAKERGYKNVLIFEDDFQFIVSKEELEKNITDFFEKDIPYDMLFLSYAVNSSSVTNNSFIRKILDGQTASGYIINNHYYDTLINLYDYSIPLLESTGQHWIYANDQIWKRLQPNDNWYYFTTRLGKQRPSYSDNTCKFEDYGGL
jgi:GR25 family glycosyltransferase involved in LPS biosynthesis